MARTKRSAKSHAARETPSSHTTASTVVRPRPGTPGYTWSPRQRRKFIATMKAKSRETRAAAHVAPVSGKSVSVKKLSRITTHAYHPKASRILSFVPAAILRQVETRLYDMLEHHQIKKFDKNQLMTLLAAAEDE